MSLSTRIGMAAAVLATGLVSQALALTTPYTNGFGSPTSADDFNLSYTSSTPTSNWELATDVNSNAVWKHTFAAPGSAETIVTKALGLDAPGVAGQNFTMSTDFVVTSRSTDWGRWSVGFGLLASSASQDVWTSNSYYAVSVGMALTNGGPGSYTDTLSIAKSDGGYGASLGDADLNANIALNTPYTLTVNGTYSGSSLVLSTTLLSGSSTVGSVVSSIDATPYTGNIFGYREYGAWGSSGTVEYDNFSISGAAVPEPVSLGIIALGAMGLMSRRRKA